MLERVISSTLGNVILLLLLITANMIIKDKDVAKHFLSNISYYRLKGDWWEMQSDKIEHIFHKGSVFETVIDYYNFDRHFRLILFNAIETYIS